MAGGGRRLTRGKNYAGYGSYPGYSFMPFCSFYRMRSFQRYCNDHPRAVIANTASRSDPDSGKRVFYLPNATSTPQDGSWTGGGSSPFDGHSLNDDYGRDRRYRDRVETVTDISAGSTQGSDELAFRSQIQVNRLR